MEKTDITIIGAGIVGLAISAALAKDNRSIYALEKNTSFGEETSSRNSEVIHAGIYYPKSSLKAETCVRGNRLIYEICAKNNISCKKLGKLIVAETKEEIAEVERLFKSGTENRVPDLAIIDQAQIRQLEPRIKALCALYSPSTGIVDSHNLMRYFLTLAKSHNAEFAFNSELIAIEKQASGYKLTIRDSDNQKFSFLTNVLINAAGLNADLVAELAGINIQEADYEIKFCKGEYFRVGKEKSRLITHLVYPVPDKKHLSLGIHVTPDLGGGLRLGPNAQYIAREKANYDIDYSQKEHFAASVKRILPFIEVDDLTADIAGIRPKLQGPNENFRDFIISHEDEKGFPGLINLIGIDSPGLTASCAIAERVKGMVAKII